MGVRWGLELTMAEEGSRRGRWTLRAAGGYVKDRALDQAEDRTAGPEVWFSGFASFFGQIICYH